MVACERSRVGVAHGNRMPCIHRQERQPATNLVRDTRWNKLNSAVASGPGFFPGRPMVVGGQSYKEAALICEVGLSLLHSGKLKMADDGVRLRGARGGSKNFAHQIA